MLAEGHNVPVKHMYNDNGNASLHKLPADCVQRQPYLPIQYPPPPSHDDGYTINTAAHSS